MYIFVYANLLHRLSDSVKMFGVHARQIRSAQTKNTIKFKQGQYDDVSHGDAGQTNAHL